MEELDGIHYATMVAAGFHGRRGLIVMTNAGHPPAFWYRASRDERLLTLGRTLDPSSAEGFGSQLAEATTEFRGGQPPEDDKTIIVLQRYPDPASI